MFQKFLALSAGVLTLICVAGFPGQVHAQRGRGGFRPGMSPQMGFSSGFNRRFMNPRFGAFNPGFNRPFMDSRLGAFNPGFSRPFSFGAFNPGFIRPFVEPRFSAFNPGFNRPFMTLPFIGFGF
jgi:hypothetical protein